MQGCTKVQLWSTREGRKKGEQYLIEVQGWQRVPLTGDHHHCVATDNRRSQQADKSKQGLLIRTGHSHHTERLPKEERGTIQRGFLYWRDKTTATNE